jgi:hypothetical protein
MKNLRRMNKAELLAECHRLQGLNWRAESKDDAPDVLAFKDTMIESLQQGVSGYPGEKELAELCRMAQVPFDAENLAKGPAYYLGQIRTKLCLTRQYVGTLQESLRESDELGARNARMSGTIQRLKAKLAKRSK